MAAGKWKVYDTAKEKLGQAIIDLDGHSFKMALYSSSSNCNTLTHDELADLLNEVANGNGYTAGGITLTGVTWTNTSGTIKFTCSPTQWNASGAGFQFKYAVIYDDTVSGDPLLLVCDLNVGSGNITAASGELVIITMDSAGAFTLSGATSN